MNTWWRNGAWLLVVAAVAGAVACEPADDAAERPAAMAEAPAADTVSGTRAALPNLFVIMMGLQQDMRRMSRGLWLASHDSIAVAARAIADHPRVTPEEMQTVSGVLGEDMAQFKAFDTTVHDLAIEIEQAAQQEDMQGVLRLEAQLREGCVQCHTAFRDRLREGLRP